MIAIVAIIVFLILFLFPLVVNLIVKDPELIQKLMKYYLFFFISSIICILLLASIFDLSFNNQSGNTTVADGFTIEGYEVILNVGVDNKVDVTENIHINFYESGHHGIYKFTPYWLEYTGKDNKTIKRKANIINYRSVNDPYTIDTVKKKSRIKIGSPYQTVFGDHTYTIKYTYDMGKDPFTNFDEFIFHAFGDFWGTEIKNPKIIVNMPKGIDGNKINFYKDKYRKQNINNLIDYQVNGNSLIVTGKSNLNLMESLTVDIELPDNYFVGGSDNYGWGSFTISMIILAITGLIIFMWSKYGKNHEKKIQTVEFYAPDKLSSAEIGYVYNKRQSSKKLTISLIISLASKGYIKIDELTGKDKGKIQITKLLTKPKEVTMDKDLHTTKRKISVKKLKDIGSDLTSSENTMMQYLFGKDDVKILETNINKFLEVRDDLINKGYIEIIEDNENIIQKEKELIDLKYADKIKKFKELKKQYEKDLEIYNQKKDTLEPKTSLENIVYGKLFSVGDTVILSEHTSFYQCFSEVNKELSNTFNKKVIDEVAKKKRKTSIILSIIIIILSLISFFGIEDLNPKLSILYYLSFGCIFVSIFFTIIMGRKTQYGEAIHARVMGFRDFLDTAEKEKLESLVEQNPHYFYDILPYTYVLGISKKWVKKFENIKMPEVDMGSFNYYDGDSSISLISHDVYYPVYTSSGSSGSSGCSSCGGGCSSCGGGCSSCGGGGSW